MAEARIHAQQRPATEPLRSRRGVVALGPRAASAAAMTGTSGRKVQVAWKVVMLRGAGWRAYAPDRRSGRELASRPGAVYIRVYTGGRP
jgi:hypothetical protein